MPAFQSLGRLPLAKDGEEEMSVAFLERETFFVSAHSLHFPHLPSFLFHLLSLAVFTAFLSPLLFLIPPFTNVHILPFSLQRHNPPFPVSSLSHLHPLVAFVGKSISSIPSSICPCISNLARFQRFFQFCYLLLPSSVRFLTVEAENLPQSLPRTIISRFSRVIPRLVALISMQPRFSISNSAHRRTVSSFPESRILPVDAI